MESVSESLQTKISDSGYSNSCSNGNSQRSASSKSRLSGSNSSRSSGYCGVITCGNESLDNGPQTPNKRNKDKDYKKKKLKFSSSNANAGGNAKSSANVNEARIALLDSNSDRTMGVELLPSFTSDIQDSTSQALESHKSNIVTPLTPVIPKIQSSTNENSYSYETDEGHGTDSAENKKNGDEINGYVDPLDVINKANAFEPEDGFCCIISMYDGAVLYTTPSLTNVLGFPKNMWLGRSFTDYVHPKDRETFLSQITMGLAVPFIDSMGKRREVKSSFYVCFRKYRGLKTAGYGITEKGLSYQAFHLSVTFKNIADCANATYLDNSREKDIFLVIAAVPIYSSYKVPEERKKSKKFGMRHTASCTFSHVDADVVMNFGYLPQDMLGKSVFDFYHPEDFPFLKEIYESILNKCQIPGSVYKSRPYRFAVRNGDFAMIETEWSCFINPWSRRLEYVTGLHRVLQGPTNPNVFDAPRDVNKQQIPEVVLKKAKVIQDEILVLLNQELLRPSTIAKHEVSKRCKDLVNFLETIMIDVKSKELSSRIYDVSVSERESVMLGEISPHHDYYNRDSSSETPPSYNQLNYNENIERFFNSKPLTSTSDESCGRPAVLLSISDAVPEGKSASVERPSNNTSGSGSAGNQSSESTPTSKTNGFYKQSHLTEELLHRHNEDMEKIMRQRHREHRCTIKADRENKKPVHKIERNPLLEKIDNQFNSPLHGVKRGGSNSREGDSHKVSKHKHQISVNAPEDANPPKNDTSKIFGVSNGTSSCTENGFVLGVNDGNIWQPFSVAMTPITYTQAYNVHAENNFRAGMFPVYYIPTPSQPSTNKENAISSHLAVQYMPGMMYNYNPVFPTPPLFCPPMTMVPIPMSQQAPHLVPNAAPRNSTNNFSNDFKLSPPNGEAKLQRPSSQATSIKAEPGSAVGSVASAICINRGLSVCSPKDPCLPSVCSSDFPVVSPHYDERHIEHCGAPTKAQNIQQNSSVTVSQDEESSYSSFYSSFLKTDTGSGSNDDSVSMGNKNKPFYQKPRKYPIRKCDPPWLEAVTVTPELIYKYQVTTDNLESILEADLKAMEKITQPLLVNDQLNQLYIEMEMEGLSTNLILEEELSSSTTSSEEYAAYVSSKKPTKGRSHSSLMMVFEEDAPMPPPDLK